MKRVAVFWIVFTMLSCLLVIEIPPRVGAVTIYVDDSGGADYLTIQEGVDAASEGDTVYVYSGFYFENIIIYKRISVIGENSDTTTIDGNSGGDVVEINADYANFTGFTVRNSGTGTWDGGIKLRASYNNIYDNIVSNNWRGIYIIDSNESNIYDNSVNSNDDAGILVVTSQRCSIENNHVYSNLDDGIRLWESGDVIADNVIYDNNLGISLAYCSGVQVTGNRMTNDGIAMGGWPEDWNAHTIDTSNTVNDKPVHYWKNQTQGTIPPGAGQVILANCTNVKVEGQEITHTDYGILCGWSSFNNITNNNISSNHVGVEITNSHDNEINENDIHFNTCGIDIFSSDRNAVFTNDISENSEYGVLVEFADENRIVLNIISSNNLGVHVDDAEDNRIYHNSFISNTVQATDDDYSGYWDNGYPDGGNFWSDYTGVDEKSGSGQNDPGSDGFGDTFYEIYYKRYDNYPLMTPLIGDYVAPVIQLISPANNSFIRAGTVIDFWISDANLDKVSYSKNGGSHKSLEPPYDIETHSWSDEEYIIEILTADTYGNTNESWYRFNLDSVMPSISLDSPHNNSFSNTGFVIELSISDTNLVNTSYSRNSGPPNSFSEPYDIDATNWPDGDYRIEVYADDLAGNVNEQWYIFTIDTIKPEISLKSPENDTLILFDTTIDFDISDDNLLYTFCSMNSGSPEPFEAPYDIDTTEMEDGDYIIAIEAHDMAGNINEMRFFFTLDTTSPCLLQCTPAAHSTEIHVESEIVIVFSEPMDTGSVESAISIDPYTEYNLSWNEDNTTLTLHCLEPLGYRTYYEVTVSVKARDVAGRTLDNKVSISFTTEDRPDDGDGEFPVMLLLLAVMIAVAGVLLALFVVTRQKKRAAAEMEVVPMQMPPMAPAVQAPRSFTPMQTTSMQPGVPMAPTAQLPQMAQAPMQPAAPRSFTPMPATPAPAAPVQPTPTPVSAAQAPQTLQVRCSKCQNLFGVKDLGVTMKVACPFCSMGLTVQSQKPAAPPQPTQVQPAQPQQQMQPVQPLPQVQPVQPQPQVLSVQPEPPAQPSTQPTTHQITCPRCKSSFSIMKTAGPMHIQCPNCGLTGQAG